MSDTGSLPDGIASFYWIDKSGVTRYKWYATSALAACREEKDDMLSGFITAIMSFTKEMFQGEQISHMDLLNQKIFFSTLPSRDILALVTSMSYSNTNATRTLEFLLRNLERIQIPEMDNCADESGLIKPHLLEALKEASNLSPENIMRGLLDKHLGDPEVLSQMILVGDSTIPDKKIKDELDFDVNTFLESVFWEKEVLMHKDMSATTSRAFNLGNLDWLSLFVANVVVTVFFLPGMVVSEVFAGHTRYTLIEAKAREILDALKTQSN